MASLTRVAADANGLALPSSLSCGLILAAGSALRSLKLNCLTRSWPMSHC